MSPSRARGNSNAGNILPRSKERDRSSILRHPLTATCPRGAILSIEVQNSSGSLRIQIPTDFVSSQEPGGVQRVLLLCASQLEPPPRHSLVYPRRSGSTHWMSNFRRLVLGCIDSYDSEQRRIFLHFSRSTRLAFFCTAPISNFADVYQFFRENFRIFSDFCKFLLNFRAISAKSTKF